MFNMTCQKCKREFSPETLVGYCEPCRAFFLEIIGRIRTAVHSFPGALQEPIGYDPKDCPHTFTYKTGKRERELCGLCGSGSLENGYGLVPGYGCAGYTYCLNCLNFLNAEVDCGEC